MPKIISLTLHTLPNERARFVRCDSQLPHGQKWRRHHQVGVFGELASRASRCQQFHQREDLQSVCEIISGREMDDDFLGSLLCSTIFNGALARLPSETILNND